MKNGLVWIGVLLALGCGGGEQAIDAGGSEAVSEATGDGGGGTATRVEPAGGDPCAPLERELVAWDNSGTAYPFRIEYPQGWNRDELVAGGATSIDFVHDLDGDGGSDYVLRFGSTENRIENARNYLKLWPNIGMEVTEVPFDGGTVHIGKGAMGEMIAYQALIFEGGSADGWLVSGGVTLAPDECEAEALGKVEAMLRTLEPNPGQVPSVEADGA